MLYADINILIFTSQYTCARISPEMSLVEELLDYRVHAFLSVIDSTKEFFVKKMVPIYVPSSHGLQLTCLQQHLGYSQLTSFCQSSGFEVVCQCVHFPDYR